MKIMRTFLLSLMAAMTTAMPLYAAEPVASFPVLAAAQAKGLEYHWDPLMKNLVLFGKEGNIKLHVGSEFVLDRNKFTRLDNKVIYDKGEVLAPLSLQYYINRLTPHSPAMPKKNVPKPLIAGRVRKVIIDAGHGGHDFGAISPGGLREKDVTLEVSRSVADELIRQGVDVVMTRSRDIFIPLSGRTNIANEKKADLFISIHANASPSKVLSGFEIYTPAGSTDGRIRRLADNVADSVEASVSIANRRIKPANFYVLKWAEHPAILIELGYLTNREDEELLDDPIYRQSIAKAIVTGILNYKNE